MLTAEAFIQRTRLDDAVSSLTEARSIAWDEPPSQLSYLEGMLAEKQGNTKAAKEHYERALVYNTNRPCYHRSPFARVRLTLERTQMFPACAGSAPFRWARTSCCSPRTPS